MATDMRLLLTGVLLCSLSAMAESLPDPTRPAIDLYGNVPGSGLPAGETSRGLQSIIISPNYRAAVINGETVRLGGKTGNYKLVEVRENSVVLQNAQGRRVMELFPRAGIRKGDPSPDNNSHIQEDSSGEIELPVKKVVGEVK